MGQQFYQQHPELTAAQRFFDANAELIARALRRLKGAGSEGDVEQARAGMAQRFGVQMADTRGVAMRVQDDLNRSVNQVTGQVPGNKDFQFAELPEAARPEMGLPGRPGGQQASAEVAHLRKLTPGMIRQLIVEEAQRQGIDPALALSVARQESGFNPGAVSPTNVVGLFQVTNKTGAAYGQTSQTRTDPQVSARAGLAYLADLLRQSQGDVRTALRRYGGADAGGDPRYDDHVLQHYPVMQAALAQARAPQQVVTPLSPCMVTPMVTGAPGRL
jgi:soluble lytic murein transglycosylase-like protein